MKVRLFLTWHELSRLHDNVQEIKTKLDINRTHSEFT